MSGKQVMVTPRGARAFELLDGGAQDAVATTLERIQREGPFGTRLAAIEGKATYAVPAGMRRVLVVEEPDAVMVLDIVLAPSSGGPGRLDEDGAHGRLDGKKASGF